MDFDRLRVRFRQFGGWRLVVQYAKMGVLWLGVKEILKCAFNGRSFKSVYPKITKHVDEILCRKYSPLITSNRREETKLPCEKAGENSYIWFCWLQGMDQAPEMVKVCLESQKRMFGDRIVVLDDKNYKEWVTLPDYIEEKYRKGRIPSALFSDLLRLELLIEHGGTWIDSSVLFTTPLSEEDGGIYYPTIDEIRNSELFIFRYFRKGRVTGMSNWFIHAKPHNALLMDVRDMLLAYWRDYNCTVEYYIFHLFFGFAAKKHTEMIERMPKGNSYHSIMLGDALGKTYDANSWKELTKHVFIHKMNYRQEGTAKANPDSYWNHIVNFYKSFLKDNGKS